MPDVDSNALRFWLLTGDAPSGPFTIAHIHRELAAGSATWQTKACPLGSTVWRSLLTTEGLGPAAADRDGFPPASVVPPADGEATPAAPPLIASRQIVESVCPTPSPEQRRALLTVSPGCAAGWSKLFGICAFCIVVIPAGMIVHKKLNAPSAKPTEATRTAAPTALGH